MIEIDRDGRIAEKVTLTSAAMGVCTANKQNYDRNGFKKPWIAYLVSDGETVVGTCAFKTPPMGGRVEIAYFTFPEFEGHGWATKMAKKLIEISRAKDPHILIYAQTLAEENASTKILSRLGFVKTKELHHPEDGNIWEWELLN